MTRKTTKREPETQDPGAKAPSHPADPEHDDGDDAAVPEGNQSARAGRVNPDA